jgi:hypothetical protein
MLESSPAWCKAVGFARQLICLVGSCIVCLELALSTVIIFFHKPTNLRPASNYYFVPGKKVADTLLTNVKGVVPGLPFYRAFHSASACDFVES